jgi:hypothetical protein
VSDPVFDETLAMAVPAVVIVLVFIVLVLLAHLFGPKDGAQ